MLNTFTLLKSTSSAFLKYRMNLRNKKYIDDWPQHTSYNNLSKSYSICCHDNLSCGGFTTWLGIKVKEEAHNRAITDGCVVSSISVT